MYLILIELSWLHQPINYCKKNVVLYGTILHLHLIMLQNAIIVMKKKVLLVDLLVIY